MDTPEVPFQEEMFWTFIASFELMAEYDLNQARRVQGQYEITLDDRDNSTRP
jgi:hypothetical protein